MKGPWLSVLTSIDTTGVPTVMASEPEDTLTTWDSIRALHGAYQPLNPSWSQPHCVGLYAVSTNGLNSASSRECHVTISPPRKKRKKRLLAQDATDLWDDKPVLGDIYSVEIFPDHSPVIHTPSE